MPLPARLDSLIFDLDGTLTDSQAGILGCLETALRAYSIPWQGSLDWFIGPPAGESFERLLPDASPAHRNEVLQHYRRCYRERGWKENAVYPGMRELLAALHARGARLYLCTSKREEFMRLILDHFELAPLFSGVIADSGASEHHDKADLLRDLIAAHNIEHAHAAMIGDRLFDVQAARTTGVASVAVLYGFGSPEELRAAKPDAIVSSVAELAETLLARAPHPASTHATG